MTNDMNYQRTNDRSRSSFGTINMSLQHDELEHHERLHSIVQSLLNSIEGLNAQLDIGPQSQLVTVDTTFTTSHTHRQTIEPREWF